jgi:hypothetical protein
MTSLQGDDGVPSGFTPSKPFGVWGDSGTETLGGGGNGVIGSSRFYTGIAGFTLSSDDRAAGVFGGGHIGVGGGVTGSNTVPNHRAGVGVYGTGSGSSNLGGIGVQGVSDTSVGVLGVSDTGVGALGESSDGDGVRGESMHGAGMRAYGFRDDSAGLIAISNGTAVVGLGAPAGEFYGDVYVTGTLSKGSGGFKIDHPLDPANKYLSHSFVESPDMKNVYDGTVLLDDRGEAIIELPAWFDTLNKEFRYQLTPVGAPGPNLYIAEEINNLHFKIAGGSPSLKICWQVTGIRQDAWARTKPVVVEQEKPANERGRFLHPEAQGYPAQQNIAESRHPERLRQFREHQP